MVVWKCCDYFQSTPLSVSTSFSPSPWDTHDPWQLPRRRRASASPRLLPDPLCSSTFPHAAWVMSCCSGLHCRKHSGLMFSGAKMLLNYFEWNGFVLDGVIGSHQALLHLYTVSICSYTLLCHGKDSCVASILGRAICHLYLASPLHTSRKTVRIWG